MWRLRKDIMWTRLGDTDSILHPWHKTISTAFLCDDKIKTFNFNFWPSSVRVSVLYLIMIQRFFFWLNPLPLGALQPSKGNQSTQTQTERIFPRWLTTKKRPVKQTIHFLLAPQIPDIHPWEIDALARVNPGDWSPILTQVAFVCLFQNASYSLHFLGVRLLIASIDKGCRGCLICRRGVQRPLQLTVPRDLRASETPLKGMKVVFEQLASLVVVGKQRHIGQWQCLWWSFQSFLQVSRVIFFTDPGICQQQDLS